MLVTPEKFVTIVGCESGWIVRFYMQADDKGDFTGDTSPIQKCLAVKSIEQDGDGVLVIMTEHATVPGKQHAHAYNVTHMRIRLVEYSESSLEEPRHFQIILPASIAVPGYRPLSKEVVVLEFWHERWQAE